MTRLRWHAKVILIIYLVLLAWALLAPTSEHQSGMVVWLGDRLAAIGAPADLIRFDRLEILMNALIIAPVSFFGSLLLPRWTWRDWTAWVFAGATAVELIQGLLLSDRIAQFSDIVANTSGALLGAIAWDLCLALKRRRRMR